MTTATRETLKAETCPPETWLAQAAKRARENEEAVAALETGAEGRQEEAEEGLGLLPHQRALLEAAVGAVRPGEAEAGPRFRDPDFFLADARQNDAAEQGFAINDRGGALDSAVLDLLADDEVLSPLSPGQHPLGVTCV